MNNGATGYIQQAIIDCKIVAKTAFLNLPNRFLKGYGEYIDIKKSLGFTSNNFLKKIRMLLKK